LVSFQTDGPVISASGTRFSAVASTSLAALLTNDVEVEINGRRYPALIDEKRVHAAADVCAMHGVVWSLRLASQ
jgi:hypothetical protein